jgi:hypothetical protein
MKNKRPLAPAFINKLDAWLLLNKPDTWSARTHLVLYYSLLFILVLATICFLKPDDARYNSDIYIWGFLVGVLAAIGFIIWLVYLLRFNVFKRFGLVIAGDRIKTFLLYFISIGVMVGAIYVPAFVETYRANRAYGNDELVTDVNQINLAICQLNYDSLPRAWDYDTLLVKNVKPELRYDERGRVIVEGHEDNFSLVDTAEFAYRKMQSDSLVPLNDSMYISYKCPDYAFVNAQGAGLYAGVEELSAVDLFNRVVRQPMPFNREATVKQLATLVKKYNTETEEILHSEYYTEDEESANAGTHERMNRKYHTSAINRAIGNISDRKYRWDGLQAQVYIRLFWYSVLTLSLLVFVFRHSSVRTFFLTLLTVLLLLIINTLFLAVFNAGTATIFTLLLLYYLLFLLLACLVYTNKTRKLVTGIALNITVFFVAFIPLVSAVLYYQVLRDADTAKSNGVYDFTKYKQEDLHYLYAEIIGAVLLLVLIETVFKQLYRKWYALPED